MAQWSGADPHPKAVVGFRIDPQPVPQWKLRAVANHIQQKRAKEAQKVQPKKRAPLGDVDCPDTIEEIEQEEQQLKQELADLYTARNKLLWLLRRSTEAEIQRNHDANMYPRSSQRR